MLGGCQAKTRGRVFDVLKRQKIAVEGVEKVSSKGGDESVFNKGKVMSVDGQ